MELYTTEEGLYIVKSNYDKSIESNQLDIEIKTIHELEWTETDGVILKTNNEIKRLKKELCSEFIARLKKLTESNDVFDVIEDTQGKKIIVYALNEIIFIPKCIQIKEIQPIENDGLTCYKDIKVSFLVENKTFEGYLTNNRIIRTTSPIVNCSMKHTFRYLPQDNLILKDNGKEITTSEAKNKMDLLSVLGMSFQINFPHHNKIIQELELANNIKTLRLTDLQQTNWNTKVKNNEVAINALPTAVKYAINGIQTIEENTTSFFTNTKKIIITILTIILCVIVITAIIYFILKYIQGRSKSTESRTALVVEFKNKEEEPYASPLIKKEETPYISPIIKKTTSTNNITK